MLHTEHTRSVIMGLGGERNPLRTSLEQGLQCTVKPSRLCRSRPKADNSLVSLHIEQSFITLVYTIEKSIASPNGSCALNFLARKKL